MRRRHRGLAALVFTAEAQVPAGVTLPPGFKLPEPTPNDTLVSPEVGPDRRITFRLYAPLASAVVLNAEILDFGKTLDLTKVWQGRQNLSGFVGGGDADESWSASHAADV